MTYEQFKTEYIRLFNIMFSYTPNQVGSSIYCEKLANLAEMYPDFELQLDQEHAE